jgi:hypothetical protein
METQEIRCTVRACAFCQESTCTARPHNLIPNCFACPAKLILPDGAGGRLRGVYRRQKKGGAGKPAPSGRGSGTARCIASP